MKPKNRLLLAFLILVGVSAGVLGLEAWRGARLQPVGDAALAPGAVPVYLDGKLAAYFSPLDLEQLELASFVDAEEGKTQEGWMLRDVLVLYLPPIVLESGTRIVVASSSNEKTVELTWDEVVLSQNNVMFDLSGRGTLKLVSQLERLDSREEWVQDVDRIEVFLP